MDNNFLLTYMDNDDDEDRFAWFESEEELIGWVNLMGNMITVREAIQIIDAKNIKLNGSK